MHIEDTIYFYSNAQSREGYLVAKKKNTINKAMTMAIPAAQLSTLLAPTNLFTIAASFIPILCFQDPVTVFDHLIG